MWCTKVMLHSGQRVDDLSFCLHAGGGTAVVYLAETTDGSNQRVAIKVMMAMRSADGQGAVRVPDLAAFLLRMPVIYRKTLKR